MVESDKAAKHFQFDQMRRGVNTISEAFQFCMGLKFRTKSKAGYSAVRIRMFVVSLLI